MPSFVEIDPVALKKKIFKVHMYILTISLNPLGKKGKALNSNKHESPSPKDALFQV